MKSLEAVSVVIPTHNRAHLIGRAVDSVLSQLLPGDELIVVDDGSSDETEAVVRSRGGKTRYVRQEKSGAGKARNSGVNLARSPLIAFLDSDDEWMPDSLLLRRRVLAAKPEVVFAFSDFAVRDQAGAEHRRYLYRWHRDPRPWSEILGSGTPFSRLSPGAELRRDFPVYLGDLYCSELAANYVFTSTVIVRKAAAGEALYFGEGMATYEDWLCFGLLSRKGTAAYVDCETAWQHGHPGPRLTGADEVRTADARLALLGRVWGRDAEFMTAHREAYDRVVAMTRLGKVKGLIKANRMTAAREELALVPAPPLKYKMLAKMPGFAVVAAVRATRRLRNAVEARRGVAHP